MKKFTVFYHGNCPDGFGAAYAAWKRLGDSAAYIPVLHGKEFIAPDVTGHFVYVLDFCFKPEILDQLASKAEVVMVLDHHKTWIDVLAGYSNPKVQLKFDMNHSGAVLSWLHFHPGEPIPVMLQHVEDRDLWKWQMPSSNHYLAGLDYIGLDFERWDMLASHVKGSREYENIISTGEVLSVQFENYCAELASKASPICLDGKPGLVKNMAGKSFVSRVGNLLADRAGTFALMWCVNEDGNISCSLRSVPDFDVCAIAEKFGGGGHKNAAGFTLPYAQLTELLEGKL